MTSPNQPGTSSMSLKDRVRRLATRPAAKIADVRFMAELFPVADAHAARLGDGPAGAEHLLLAALDLPDGTGRAAFRAAGLDPDGFETALVSQHREALAALGEPGLDTLDAQLDDAVAATGAPMSGKSSPSGREMFRVVVDRLRAEHSQLTGAWFVLVASEQTAGTVARALDAMGADRTKLADAARAEIDTFEL